MSSCFAAEDIFFLVKDSPGKVAAESFVVIYNAWMELTYKRNVTIAKMLHKLY